MVPLLEALVILVMSFNVRYYNSADGINSWENRKEIVINIIEEQSPDLLGLQEVCGKQLHYLEKELSNYNHIGESRTKDPEDEHSPIFYSKNKFELINSNTFWLSETPEIPSKGWDAAFNRIVTWGKFKHKETGKTVFFFNTHFDHQGEQAKLKSAKLLRQKVKEIAGKEDYIVSGDFNISPSTQFYNSLTSQDSTMSYFADVSQYSPQTKSNIKGTFNGFDKSKEPEGPIDYIFVKPVISVISYDVINKLYNGRFPSDHYPIVAELKLMAE